MRESGGRLVRRRASSPLTGSALRHLGVRVVPELRRRKNPGGRRTAFTSGLRQANPTQAKRIWCVPFPSALFFFPSHSPRTAVPASRAGGGILWIICPFPDSIRVRGAPRCMWCFPETWLGQAFFAPIISDDANYPPCPAPKMWGALAKIRLSPPRQSRRSGRRRPHVSMAMGRVPGVHSPERTHEPDWMAGSGRASGFDLRPAGTAAMLSLLWTFRIPLRSCGSVDRRLAPGQYHLSRASPSSRPWVVFPTD